MGKGLKTTATVVAAIGAVNWGFYGIPKLIGGSGVDLVNALAGSVPMLANFVYGLVGVAGVMTLVYLFKRK